MSTFRPANIEEARANFKPLRRTGNLARNGLQKRGTARQADSLSKDGNASGGSSRAKPATRKSLKTKPDPELVAWGKQVRKRDGNQCQWSNCEFCRGNQDVTLDPHHIALRSARHDLRLVLSNGITVCRARHNFIHSPEGRDEAVAKGFLNLRSRELAAKEGALGIR